MLYVDLKVAFPEVPDRIVKEMYNKIGCIIRDETLVRKPTMTEANGYWIMELLFKTEDIDVVDSLKDYLQRNGIHDVALKNAETIMLMKAFSKMSGIELDYKAAKLFPCGSYSITIMQSY